MDFDTHEGYMQHFILKFFLSLLLVSISLGIEAEQTDSLQCTKQSITPNNNTQVQSKKTQANITPLQAYQLLKDGNLRFVDGHMQSRNLLAQAKLTASEQYPFAVVLNCIDSRTPPELVLDQGIGDIFAIRIAGNIINDDILGSMEFGTQLVGAKLIAVIGHTSCGAIRGACQHAKLGNLTNLLQKIQPAVNETIKKSGSHDCNKSVLIDDIAKNNVLLVMKQIPDRSPIIKKLIEQGKLAIVGGIQDLATGRITFFDDKVIMQSHHTSH